MTIKNDIQDEDDDNSKIAGPGVLKKNVAKIDNCIAKNKIYIADVTDKDPFVKDFCSFFSKNGYKNVDEESFITAEEVIDDENKLHETLFIIKLSLKSEKNSNDKNKIENIKSFTFEILPDYYTGETNYSDIESLLKVSHKKIGLAKTNINKANDKDAMSIQEIIQGLYIHCALNDISINEIKPYEERAGLIFINKQFELLKEDKNPIYSVRKDLLDKGITTNWAIGFDKLPEALNELKSNKAYSLNGDSYKILHPDLTTNGFRKDEVDLIFGQGIDNKDVVAPADVYIVDTSKNIDTIISGLKSTGIDKKKNIVNLTNQGFNDKSLIAVSLKKSKNPKLFIINNKEGHLPNFTINDISSIKINKNGNSEVIFHEKDYKGVFSDEFSKKLDNEKPDGKFEFRSKDSGKTWQCNATIVGVSDAYFGGSVKDNIKTYLEINSGQKVDWDADILEEEREKVKSVFEKFNGRVKINNELNNNSRDIFNALTYPLSQIDKGNTIKSSIKSLSEKTLKEQYNTSKSSMRGRCGLYRFLLALTLNKDEKNNQFEKIIRMSFKMSEEVQNSLKIM